MEHVEVLEGAHLELDDRISQVRVATEQDVSGLVPASRVRQAAKTYPGVPWHRVDLDPRDPDLFTVVHGHTERGNVIPGSKVFGRLNFREAKNAYLKGILGGAVRRDDGSYESYGDDFCVHTFLAVARRKGGFARTEGDAFIQSVSIADQCHMVFSQVDNKGGLVTPDDVYQAIPGARKLDNLIAVAEARVIGRDLKLIVSSGKDAAANTKALLRDMSVASGSSPKKVDVNHTQTWGMDAQKRAPLPALQAMDVSMLAISEACGREVGEADRTCMYDYVTKDRDVHDLEEEDRMRERNYWPAGGGAPKHWTEEARFMMKASQGGPRERDALKRAGRLTEDQSRKFFNSDLILMSSKQRNEMYDNGEITDEQRHMGRFEDAWGAGVSGRDAMVEEGRLTEEEREKFVRSDYLLSNNATRAILREQNTSEEDTKAFNKMDARRANMHGKRKLLDEGKLSKEEFDDMTKGNVDHNVPGAVWCNPKSNMWEARFQTTVLLAKGMHALIEEFNSSKRRQMKLASNYRSEAAAREALARCSPALAVGDEAALIQAFRAEKVAAKARHGNKKG